MCAKKKLQSTNLRLIPIFTFFISIALSIPNAVVFERVTPAIGLIVCFFSGFTSLLSYPWRKAFAKVFRRRSTEYRIVLTTDDEDDDELPWAPLVNVRLFLFSDTLLAALSLMVYVLGTMDIGRGWCSRGDILGTYATLPYLVNFAVHGYLAILELVAVLKEPRKPTHVSCPHCHKSLVGASSLNDDGSEDRGDRGVRMSGGVPPEAAQV